ncbi:hypothetical protein BDR07DRAFT_1385163 [Suillus spraguei]|nr:hypothetical protein BDR07DRAFT_1385163 [Suillus spraguei]
MATGSSSVERSLVAVQLKHEEKNSKVNSSTFSAQVVPEYFGKISNSLLSLIEESNTYCKAFGFMLLGSGKVPLTGDWPVNLYQQLATALFLNYEDSPWKDVDLNDLAETVKNHMMKLSQEKSPAVDCSTVSNSASQLDLTILDCSQTIGNNDEIPIKWPHSPTPEYTKDDDKSSTIFILSHPPPISL